MKKILIVGGEGTALNIAEAIDDAEARFNYTAKTLGFINDSLEKVGPYPVVARITDLYKFYNLNDVEIVFCLYKPNVIKARVEVFKSLNIPPHKIHSFIHPNSNVSRSAQVGRGNIVLSGSIIQSLTRIGNFNIINNNVVIEHNTIIGSNNFFAASAVIGSNVNIGDGNFIGLNTTIRESINIEHFSFLGMGSVLVSNIETESVYYGVPAKKK
jgi:sugar O-acyltransferase (sialic acid O-acetyltransferase NeuD family)